MASEMEPIATDDVGFEKCSTKDEEIKALTRKANHMRKLAIAFGVIALVALGVVVGLLINFSISEDTPDDLNGPLYCNDRPDEFKGPRNLLGDPAHPSVFHGLTDAEIRRVWDFLEKEINMTRPNEKSTLRDARVFTMDIELPQKKDVINFLDHGGMKPDRYARVMLLRGDLQPPVVQEHICGPLHNISSCNVVSTVPFALRPLEAREYKYWDNHLTKEIHRLFGDIIRESYGGSFDIDECEDDCMNYWTVPVGSGMYREVTYQRTYWFWARYDVPFYGMFPVDMACLVNVDGVDEYAYHVEKVWYSGKLYSSPEDLIGQYKNNSIPKTKMSYPTGDETVYGNLRKRGTAEEKARRRQRPPELIEPDGKRYTVQYDKIEYMGFWSFHYRMSPLYGPGIYDVRFKGERIAYEISLQELVVQYSGFAPMPRQCTWVDSAFGLGTGSKGLVSGVDCPSTATFMKFTTASQDNYEPATFKQSTCVFENNLGHPLRRHHSYSRDDGSFYGGMADSILVVRSIHTVDNYDYVLDFKFHQNGVFGFTLQATGFPMTSYYTVAEKMYGFEVAKNVFGPMHLHAAHVKVDLDIHNGSSNRYETLNIETITVPVREAAGNRQIRQTKFSHNLKKTEEDAKYNYDFNKPKQHIFYDDSAKNEFGAHKAYRLIAKGMTPQFVDPDTSNEAAYSWARYQMAVTQRKDDEPHSSSPYNQFESINPLVDFRKFTNNEDIVDKDLVAWVTLGVHHIPQTQDVPVTTTPGTMESIYLHPYNYFTECPSMTSPDGVFMALNDPWAPEEGIFMEFQGSGDISDPGNYGTCQTKSVNVSAKYEKDPDSIFRAFYDKGVY